jgi:hypothetical protein
MSSVRPGAVVAIWNGIAEEARDEFLRWHETEHMPERVGIAGFLRGRRYRAVAGAPDYFTRYDLAGPDVMTGDAYLARLNAPTPWTLAVLPHFRDTSRALCESVFTSGAGDRAWLVTSRFLGDVAEADAAAIAEEMAAAVPDARIEFLRTDNAASGRKTAEKASRAPDLAFPAFVILAEARNRDRGDAIMQQAMRAAAKNRRCHRHGTLSAGV